jgi:hypothetical protein
MGNVGTENCIGTMRSLFLCECVCVRVFVKEMKTTVPEAHLHLCLACLWLAFTMLCVF